MYGNLRAQSLFRLWQINFTIVSVTEITYHLQEKLPDNGSHIVGKTSCLPCVTANIFYAYILNTCMYNYTCM